MCHTYNRTAVVRKLPLELSAGDRKFIKEIYSQGKIITMLVYNAHQVTIVTTTCAANPRRQSENFARNEETPMGMDCTHTHTINGVSNEYCYCTETEDSGRNGQRNTGGNGKFIFVDFWLLI